MRAHVYGERRELPRAGRLGARAAAALKLVALHLGLVMDAADLLAEWRLAGS